MTIKLHNIAILFSTLFLASCSTSNISLVCLEEEPLPIKYIESTDFSNYWKSTKSRQRVHFDDSVEQDIASGKLAGFVVVEQTISVNGTVADQRILGFFPDERVRDVYQEYGNDSKYEPVTCPIQPVRYRAVHFYSNGKKTQNILQKIYRDYEKNL